jgi:cbb3-type cytochrome oxidase maturation protein
MNAVFSLLPIALLLLALGAGALIWAVRSGQFDDLEGPAHRIIHDDDDPRIPFNQPAEDEGTEEGPEKPDTGKGD